MGNVYNMVGGGGGIKLVSIAVTTPPTKTRYLSGESFDPAGRVVTATYSNGARGTHTLLVTRSYNPTTGKLYWADSNFANTRIDGKRYGYVRAYQAWSLEEAVGWLAADMYNGATLYRLRDDIVVREGAVAPALQTDP